MPKYLIIFSTLLLLSCNGPKSPEYVVSGTLKNSPAATVYLEEQLLETGSPVIVDSAVLSKNGTYTLQTLTTGEGLYNLRLAGQPYPFISFINDTEEIEIHGDFKKLDDPVMIEGSPASSELRLFVTTLSDKLDGLQKIRFTGDTLQYKKAQRDSIRMAITSQQQASATAVKQYALSFINASKQAPLTLFAYNAYQSLAANPQFGLMPLTEEETTAVFVAAHKKFPEDKTIAAITAPLTAPKPRVAPEFSLPDLNGQPFSLRSLQGNYVLVDFWASWCPPCRAENPNLLATYKKYKDRNFTIVGVSLDQDKAPWQQAVKQDSLPWIQVSDLKFWNSKVVPLYNISSIPYNVLLDTSGIIIAERLSGELLDTKLSNLLK